MKKPQRKAERELIKAAVSWYDMLPDLATVDEELEGLHTAVSDYLVATGQMLDGGELADDAGGPLFKVVEVDTTAEDLRVAAAEAGDAVQRVLTVVLASEPAVMVAQGLRKVWKEVTAKV